MMERRRTYDAPERLNHLPAQERVPRVCKVDTVLVEDIVLAIRDDRTKKIIDLYPVPGYGFQRQPIVQPHVGLVTS